MAARFRDLLELLEKHEVLFVVIGGAAMVLQGSAYTTEDFDVLYERSQRNCERLAAALAEIEPRLRVERVPEGLAARLDARAWSRGI